MLQRGPVCACPCVLAQAAPLTPNAFPSSLHQGPLPEIQGSNVLGSSRVPPSPLPLTLQLEFP